MAHLSRGRSLCLVQPGTGPGKDQSCPGGVYRPSRAPAGPAAAPLRSMISTLVLTTLVVLSPLEGMAQATAPPHARARALRVAPGTLEPGTANSITDVAGVRVGQTTVIRGDSVHTGITAVLPHQGNLFFDRVPAAIVVGNGFGKLLGSTQVNELGELETPILLTCTLCVWKAADAMVEWMLGHEGMQNVRSINPVVGETNDGYELNTAIRSRPVTSAQVRQALTSARTGEVEEGS